VADRLDADEVAHLAFGPARGRHHLGDAVDPRGVRRQVDEHAAEHVVAVEGEVVRDDKRAGIRAVVGPEADHVAGVEVAEEVLADAFHRGRLDEDEQAVVAGQVRPLDGGAKLFPQLFQPAAARHGGPPFPVPAGRAAGAGRPPSQRK
jgi:hypothetical protein